MIVFFDLENEFACSAIGFIQGLCTIPDGSIWPDKYHLVHESEQEDYQAQDEYYDNKSKYARLDESCWSAREPVDI